MTTPVASLALVPKQPTPHSSVVGVPSTAPAEQLIKHLDQLLKLENHPPLAPPIKQQLDTLIQDGLGSTRDRVQEFLQGQVPETEHARLREVLDRTFFPAPSGKTSWRMAHFLAWQYLPAAVLTVLVTNAVLTRYSSLSDEQRHAVVNREAIRQASSGTLHVLQTYGSMLAVDGAVLLAGQHGRVVALNQWLGRAAPGLAKFTSPGLQRMAHTMKQTWHLLATQKQNVFSAVWLALLTNTLGFGIVRPIVTDMAYIAASRPAHVPLPQPASSPMQPATTTPTPIPTSSATPLSAPAINGLNQSAFMASPPPAWHPSGGRLVYEIPAAPPVAWSNRGKTGPLLAKTPSYGWGGGSGLVHAVPGSEMPPWAFVLNSSATGS